MGEDFSINKKISKEKSILDFLKCHDFRWLEILEKVEYKKLFSIY